MAVSGGLRGGVVAAAKQLYLEQGGIRAFYKGLGPTLVADVVGTALGFTLYDTLTAAYRERCVGGRKATPFEKGVLGGVGACCSMTVTMPLEVVMTRMRVMTTSSGIVTVIEQHAPTPPRTPFSNGVAFRPPTHRSRYAAVSVS